MNICNLLTVGRVFGAIGVFLLLGFYESPRPYLLDAALVLFIVSAFTDFLDGVLARRLKMETTFGRIADPFSDKLLVCGTFIFLIPLAKKIVPPWAVALIVMREFLVSGVRSYLESRGMAFGALLTGKLKVLLQYVTASVVIFYVAHCEEGGWGETVAQILVYTTVVVTAASAVQYLLRAVRLLKGHKIV